MCPFSLFLPVRCYASAVIDRVSICCLSVCLSQAGVLSKWLNVWSGK